MEFGLGQHQQVQILLERARAYDEIGQISDADGNPLVAMGRFKA